MIHLPPSISANRFPPCGNSNTECIMRAALGRLHPRIGVFWASTPKGGRHKRQSRPQVSCGIPADSSPRTWSASRRSSRLQSSCGPPGNNLFIPIHPVATASPTIATPFSRFSGSARIGFRQSAYYSQCAVRVQIVRHIGEHHTIHDVPGIRDNDRQKPDYGKRVRMAKVCQQPILCQWVYLIPVPFATVSLYAFD